MYLFLLLQYNRYITLYSFGHFKAPAREMVIDELDADELPQPIFSNSGMPSVKCKVCNNLIDLDGKLDCYVVKCHCCQEATVSQLLK